VKFRSKKKQETNKKKSHTIHRLTINQTLSQTFSKPRQGRHGSAIHISSPLHTKKKKKRERERKEPAGGFLLSHFKNWLTTQQELASAVFL
jgi:hypothetical protein